MTDKKTCTSCGQTKPLAEFHRYTGKTARSPDGHRSICKECRCAKERFNYRRRVILAAVDG